MGNNSSAEDNLKFIPQGAFPKLKSLYEGDRTALFDGLELATSTAWRDAVWSMIWQRWCRLETLPTA
ncbi:MAG: hypothetical protein J6S63_11880 [Atopobiaceae bacterium]|nr:hypothetical protein [Atopobiaceae bacterium]